MRKLVGNYHVHGYVKAEAEDTQLLGYPVPRGQTAIITYMAILDNTTANKKLILGIRDGSGHDHYIDAYAGTATYTTNHSLKIEGEIVLMENEQPFGIVVSASSSDECYFTAHGGLYQETQPGD